MEREELKGYLERGLSLPQIGAIMGRDPSTVGYWVQKHGLVANGRERYAPRGGLTAEQLEPLVDEGLTLSEIARRVDRSISTARHWLKKYELLPAERTRRRPVFEQADREGLTRVEAECRRHGLVEFIKRPDAGWRCGRCRAEDVSNWRRRVKELLVSEAGGRCVLCGYDRCQGALQFHHRDPTQKKFGISHSGVTRGLAQARKEAKKCVLLCANCHAEVEVGYSNV